MKAILGDDMVIIVYPETIAERIVIQYMNEEPADKLQVVLSEQILEEDE